MIDGQQIRAARERAGLTQQQLAQAVGVGQRTVGNWERGETVPRNREAAIRAVLADHLGAPGESPLRGISDVELIAELARRLGQARAGRTGEGHDRPAATSTAGRTPAQIEWDHLADQLRRGEPVPLSERQVIETLGPRPPGEVSSPGSGGVAGHRSARQYGA